MKTALLLAFLSLSACATVAQSVNPVRSKCIDSCMNVEDRARAECLARCESWRGSGS